MASAKELTGLFLGAGASCETGMPLTWELTHELKKWLTPEKLRSLNESWRLQGGGYPDAIIEDFSKILSRFDLHYENLLGYLETQFRRKSNLSQEYHTLYSWLIQMVSYIFYYRHINNIQYIQRSLKYFDGFMNFVEQNKPLWVFSLNHDLIVECLAVKKEIPINYGFTDEVISLPRRNSRGAKIGDLKAVVLSGNHLEQSAMQFYKHGTQGINLLKIHGALDVFTFRNGKDLLKILPLESSVEGVIASLRAANEELLYVDSSALNHKVNVINEIAYADEAGEMQFLRRTLLAGAYKFDSQMGQVLPLKMLDHFRSNINFISTLVCCGYGFADNHINKVMRDWLEFRAEHHMVIVDPNATSIPATFRHIAPQIKLHKITTTEYMDSLAKIERSNRELIEKRFANWIRKNKETAKAKMQEFLHGHQSKKIDSLVAWIKTLPMRDGDIDITAHGVDLDAYMQEIIKRFAETPEDLLEKFLAIHDSEEKLRS